MQMNIDVILECLDNTNIDFSPVRLYCAEIQLQALRVLDKPVTLMKATTKLRIDDI